MGQGGTHYLFVEFVSSSSSFYRRNVVKQRSMKIRVFGPFLGVCIEMCWFIVGLQFQICFDDVCFKFAFGMVSVCIVDLTSIGSVFCVFYYVQNYFNGVRFAFAFGHSFRLCCGKFHCFDNRTCSYYIVIIFCRNKSEVEPLSKISWRWLPSWVQKPCTRSLMMNSKK